ncbi:hypothetical protein RclHR1_24290003 [Rhizophagus clarus]|uniref:Uncharacterized protein n=1 Tax=Rhizophagus clarus TaxID=94130 RepID=A0A2Z6RS20_9GLOM|nr:hypothetical protein RclHR1_24290003 [Rhizophagus clarus]
MQINQSRPGPSQHLKSTQTNQVPQRPIEEIIVANFTLPPNASFKAANKKRRKEVIKVRTIRYLQEELNSKYNKYLSRTTLNNYLLPFRLNTKAAKAHHHPAIVANASVSQTERSEHIDEHYNLASVKGAKQFAALFSTHFVIIS